MTVRHHPGASAIDASLVEGRDSLELNLQTDQRTWGEPNNRWRGLYALAKRHLNAPESVKRDSYAAKESHPGKLL